MTRPGPISGVAAVLLLAGGLFIANSDTPNRDTLRAAEQAAAKAAPKPVDDSMHEFMEYLFEPTYKRLKGSMAAGEKDRAVWKGVKSDAMILAEGGNLLLMRTPEEDAADWNGFAVAVRDLGGKLYQAAKKQNGGDALANYKAMIAKCNACHTQFADGEHQLEE